MTTSQPSLTGPGTTVMAAPPTSSATDSSPPSSNHSSIKHRRRRRRRRDSFIGSILSTSLLLAILSTSISFLSCPSSLVNSISTDEPLNNLPSIRSAPISKRDYSHIPKDFLSRIPLLSDPSKILNHRDPSSFLSSILIPRPPETSNNLKVQSLIIDRFKSMKSNWNIQQPRFKAMTPEGEKQMSNLIFTLNQEDSNSKITLAAHHDSKWFRKGSGMEGFVGATDSASPCAMLIDLVNSLDKPLAKRRRRSEWESRRWKREEEESDEILERELGNHEQSLKRSNRDEQIIKRELQELRNKRQEEWKSEHQDWFERNEKRLKREKTTLQILFFDGEEAYHTWTHTDSIYGSKSLASNWTSTYHSLSPLSPRRYLSSTTSTSLMNSIEHLVLLDLLGAKDPQVPSYFDSTNWLHDELIDIEKRLKEQDLLYPKELPKDQRDRKSSFFKKMEWHGGIEDDHLPFIANGVPVLHVIPTPFPNVWHRLADDASALDYPTTYAWAMILRTMVIEYLGLDLNDFSTRDDEDDRNSEIRPSDLDDEEVNEPISKFERQAQPFNAEDLSRKNLTAQEDPELSETANKVSNLSSSSTNGERKIFSAPVRRFGDWTPEVEERVESEEEVWEREWVEQRRRDLVEWDEKKRKREQIAR